jgi:hypothetical protein
VDEIAMLVKNYSLTILHLFPFAVVRWTIIIFHVSTALPAQRDRCPRFIANHKYTTHIRRANPAISPVYMVKYASTAEKPTTSNYGLLAGLVTEFWRGA